ncbi:MAG: hypothetical protein KDB88_01040, partial [Flavobacteriales bacterium]|nr:hypothetical protein [Flavobacteriales bacterium]
PQSTQKALMGLLDHPEVLSIMTERMDLTVTVGDMYRRDPEGTILIADSLNQVVEQETAEELAAWKERMDNDPEAREQFKKSAEAFEKEQVPDDVYYTEAEAKALREQVEDPANTERIVEHHYYEPYPYWFGYPRWYAFPRWRPYPWWYDWGFYFGWGAGWGVSWGGGWGYWGLPSFYYMNWYWGNPWNHYYYPGLSCHYINHYYGHRNSLGSIRSSTETWRRENAAALPADLSTDNPRQIEAVREFGKLEAERMEFNRQNPTKPVDQATFLRTNNEKFPTLAQEVGRERSAPLTSEGTRFDRPAETGRTTERPVMNEGGTTQERTTTRPSTSDRPSTTNTTRERTNMDPATRPSDGTRTAPTRPSTQPSTRPSTSRPGTTRPSMDRAVDMHRSGWNRSGGSRGGSYGRPSSSPSRSAPSSRTSSPSRSSGSSGGSRSGGTRSR